MQMFAPCPKKAPAVGRSLPTNCPSAYLQHQRFAEFSGSHAELVQQKLYVTREHHKQHRIYLPAPKCCHNVCKTVHRTSVRLVASQGRKQVAHRLAVANE